MIRDKPCIEVPLDGGTHANVDRLLEAVAPDTRLLFIDNPNNPTGTHVPREDLERLLHALPDHVIPVIDEAYVHFANAPSYVSALSLRGLHPNLVVLRTFSKAHGLAAVRVGYAIADREIIADLGRVRAPFNVSSIAQAGAVAALDDPDHVTAYVELNRVERARLTTALESMGLAVAPSQANFIFARLEASAQQVYEALLREGVIVRAFAALPHHLRITVGLAAENDRLLASLRKVLP